MEASVYRLAEYKIFEGETGGLSWEAHFGFATEQKGKCFRKGTILFIGPAEGDRPGYLKRDFFDRLRQFPEWSKTRYYCRGLEIFHCRTGKRVTEREMHLWGLEQKGLHERGCVLSDRAGMPSNGIFINGVSKGVAFRLQKYEITKKRDDLVVWRTYAGPNVGRGGNCIILEDILFIGSWQNERSNLIKRQFLSDLQQLPGWEQTRYFCPRLSIHECNSGGRVYAVRQEKERRPTGRPVSERNAVTSEDKNKTGLYSRKSDLWKDLSMFLTLRLKKRITALLHHLMRGK